MLIGRNLLFTFDLPTLVHHLSEDTSSSPTCRDKENLLFLKTYQSKLAMVLTSLAAPRKDLLALKTTKD